MKPRESLYDRIVRLKVRRWLLALGAVVFPALGVIGRMALDPDAWGSDAGFYWAFFGGFFLFYLAIVSAAFVVNQRGRKRAWANESVLSAAEVVSSENRESRADASEIARIRKGDFPNLDRALDLYHAAIGGKQYPLLQRLPRMAYGSRIDACARLGGRQLTLCFTPAMLETCSAEELLAVVVHLLERGQGLRSATARLVDGVREADSKTLMLTKDHGALMRVIRKSRVGHEARMAIPGDSESWFSEDGAEPNTSNDKNAPKYKRVDRLADLQSHLGALGLDDEQAPKRSASTDPKLAGYLNPETGALNDSVMEGLRK